MRLTMRDIRACGLCGPGTLTFLNAHPELRAKMVQTGSLDVSDVEHIDNADVQKVVRYVRERDDGQR